MIASLAGVLLHIEKDADTAVIECGGVGYGVSMSVSALARLGQPGDDVRVLVHTHVTQDSLRLFGFIDAAERRAFETLIGTTGVGPRLALAILSTLSPADLSQAVYRGDRAALTRIPGVGAKKAERLLVELKGRLGVHVLSVDKNSDTASAAQRVSDLVSALVNLGFAPTLAEAAARQATQQHPTESDLALLVREALRLTTRSA